MKSTKLRETPTTKRQPRPKKTTRSVGRIRSARTISATQAARTFSDLLNRIHYRGEAFVIERGGEAICAMTPVQPPRFTGADVVSVLRSLPKPDEDFWDDVEAATQQKATIPVSQWEC
jgi:antitoxin (DNA-binding transcriptional repressor) of toxin-antitoxin stability system